MCRTTFHSGSISLGGSRSVSDKVMAAEDVLGVPYSRCPLKKRPVLICQDINEPQDAGVDECGPENLSMKPEDLRVKCKSLAFTRPPTVAVPSKTTLAEDRLKPKTSETLLRRYLQSCPGSPQTFENGTLEHGVEPIRTGKPWEWPLPDFFTATHSPAPQYPRYLYQCLSSPETYGDYQHLRPSTEKADNDCQVHFVHTYEHEALHLQKSTLPNSPVNHCKVLPFYSTYRSVSMRTPSPSLTPEDLSSPGSVASSGCCSTGSTGYTEKTKEVNQKQRYQCSLCLKFYCTYSGLSKHQRSHCTDSTDSLTKKCFGCKYCEKVYVSLGALKMHIRTHTLPCKCVICGKAFSRPWLLQGHVRTHTGEKPFSCPLCERAFADRSNLRAHLQTHSEVKKYSCACCGKTFSRMSLVTKHQDGGCPGPELSPEGLTF